MLTVVRHVASISCRRTPVRDFDFFSRQSLVCYQSPINYLPSNRLPTRRRSVVYFSSLRHGDDDDDKDPNEASAPRRKNDYRVLFPHAIPDPEVDRQQHKDRRLRYPRSVAAWKRVFQCAWTNYKGTWEGFFSGSSTENDGDDKKIRQDNNGDDDDKSRELKHIIKDGQKRVSGNVEKNVAFLEEEGPKFFKFLQQETKIYTKEDLKQWAGEQLKLATLCLNEFMGGYRSGRDGEMDRMLNEYFQEQEGESSEEGGVVKRSRKRRKPKRLVRSA